MPETQSQGDAAASAPAKLDELMLAMDVVDTLRHEEGLVEKELGQDDRDAALKQRLRDLYEGQGLEVSDRILDEGIKALKESRFVYTPSPPSLSRSLATLWVKRGAYGKLLGVVILVIAAFAGWRVWENRSARDAADRATAELTIELPRRLAAAAEAARREARVDSAVTQIDRLVGDGEAGLKSGSSAEATRAIAGLDALRARLLREYELRIVSRPGEQSGVFRIPDINQTGRNYYLVVEAVAPDGSLVSLPITSEEDGKTKTVSKWGVRVPATTFNTVRRDKEDDGIVQGNVVGRKRRGDLDVEFLMPVQGGTITQW